MKKFTYLAVTLLVMAGAVSCKKNADVKEPTPQPTGVMRHVTVSAAGQGTAKTSVISGGTLIWSNDDHLSIVPTAGGFDAVALDIKDGAGTSSGTFEGDIDSGIKDDTQLYGWAGGNWAYDSGAFTVNMPTTQTYAGDGLAENAYPSIGTGTISGGITLSNPFGVLCLIVKGETTDAVKSITLTSAAKNLAGEFTVNPSSTPVTVTEGSSKTITLNCTTAVALATDGVNFRIVIPAASYADKDLTVKVTKSDDTSFNVTLGATTVTASNVTKVEVEDVPATTGEAEVKAEAGVPGNKVKWVQLWKDGPKFAEFNVGATTATGESSYGGYYTWGSSYKNGNNITWKDDHNTGSGSLTGDTDTATKLWGSNWRMPSDAEFKALWENCTVAWKSASESGHGVAGRVYTGKTEGYTGNSVFFPAAGYCHNGKVNNAGSNGVYWSSTPNGSNAFFLHFLSSNQSVDYHGRYYGQSVRAVFSTY
ncbi:MAG: fibrobacter succinogenes major paralogous domain-containing protein [Paludibacteraceae bacterium]|nr:fibrobacter succinogenes major paralogous domain-containing protein [Paludibacteraceae bacterium]